MGTSSSKKDPQHLKNLLELSKKTCQLNISEKKLNIYHLKEEIINFLNLKDVVSSREKMEIILKEEDDIIIYDILNRILEVLKENALSLVERNACPGYLIDPLNTVLYAASHLKIKELNEFKELIKQTYGSNYLSKIENKNFINEVLIEKLETKNYSLKIIKKKLKQICIEKKIDYQFIEDIEDDNQDENIQRVGSFLDHSSSYYNSSDSLKNTFTLRESNSLKRVKSNDETIEDIIEKGENLFLPYDEKIDEECYNINKIDNWADAFYGLKSGIILKKYKELISKTEYSTFFEGLNYEYGINNYSVNIKKAFDIYKKAADTTTDTLSMYRLYHIYKKDFKKFNMDKRSHVLEKFYLLKCFAYLTENQKQLFNKLYIFSEVKVLLTDGEKIYDWYLNYIDFLKDYYSYYNIKKDDVIIIDSFIYFCSESSDIKDSMLDDKINQLIELADKGNLQAIYHLTTYNTDEKYSKYFEKLYENNYYRSFGYYVKELHYKESTLAILKTSISKGYINHIKQYFYIFMNINKIKDIVKSNSLKSELIYILNVLIDNIIIDDFEVFFGLIYTRNILIKHYNFENDIKNNLDNNLKEILNYFKQFLKGNDKENKNKIKKYFIDDKFYPLIYTINGYMNYLGIKGIMKKNYDETIKKYNYLIKNDNCFFNKYYYYYYIYIIKTKQRKSNDNKNNNKNDTKETEELKQLEKKVLNIFYEYLSPDNIKKCPPTFFYHLSKFFRKNALITKDLILEYVFLNLAKNAEFLHMDIYNCKIFEENYTKYKVINKLKKKILK